MIPPVRLLEVLQLVLLAEKPVLLVSMEQLWI